MFHRLGRRRSALVLAVILLAAVLVARFAFRMPLAPEEVALADHGTPSGTITAPAGEGSPGVNWQGVVPGPSAGGQGACFEIGPAANAYYFYLHLVVPDGYYETHDARFTARIDWDSTAPVSETQEITLFLFRGGTLIATGTENEAGTKEDLAVSNLEGGDYELVVCAEVNPAPQPFNGQAFFNATLREGGSLPPPEIEDLGIRFSASTVVDPQRDIAEPSLRIDKKDNIYACGPFGASRAAEYANKSEDRGDTFRVLGTPPEGRIATGGGGDCEISVGTELNSLGNYTLSYTGLEALVNFSTGKSEDEGRTIVGQNAATTEVGVDRQWMETTGVEEVYLGYNAVARGYEVVRSTDGGLTYGPPVNGAAGIFRPGPIRIDENPEHNPLYNPDNPDVNDEIVYFVFTRGDGVFVARSYEEDVLTNRRIGWSEFEVARGFNPNNLFAVLAIDTAGNLYAAWTEKGSFNTYYAYSLRDDSGPGGSGGAGQEWSEKRLVNRAPVYSTVMPWIEAGDPGNIVVTYYGSEADGDIEVGGPNGFHGPWDVYANVSFDALDPANANDSVPFTQIKTTTHPVHWDSICVSGTICIAINGDRTLLDFFQNRLDPRGGIHIIFNQSNKIPRQNTGRQAIEIYVKQIAGPGLYESQNPTVDPRPVVRDASNDPVGDAIFPISEFAAPPPDPTNLDALDITDFRLLPACGQGNQPDAFNVELTLADASTAALQEALVEQSDSGSPASNLLFVVRWFSGTDPYSAVAKWSPATGFTFGFNDFTLDPQGRLLVYPGDDKEIPGGVSGNTITMTVTISDSNALDLPNPPEITPTIRPAVVGDTFYDMTAFTFGNASAVPEVQTYLNQGDSTAPFDYLLGCQQGGTPTPTATSIPTSSPTATGTAVATGTSTVIPSVTATGVIPSVTVTGIVPSVTATGVVPSVTATGALPSVTTTGTAVATGTGTAVATGTVTGTPEATGTAGPTGTATVAGYKLYLPVIRRDEI